MSTPGFNARIGEWRTILMSLRYTHDHLVVDLPSIADEDEHLIAYDHLERLEMLIPRIESELNEALSLYGQAAKEPSERLPAASPAKEK